MESMCSGSARRRLSAPWPGRQDQARTRRSLTKRGAATSGMGVGSGLAGDTKGGILLGRLVRATPAALLAHLMQRHDLPVSTAEPIL
jgi:hypothetical protein